MNSTNDFVRSCELDLEVNNSCKPQVINYQINDICNARCVMCNVWRRQRGPELSPDEFRTLVSKKYFSETRHIGITGGEPTLHPDLNQFYEIALEVLPNLRGGHFITNGLSRARATATYCNIATAYNARGVSFGGMVSIDGVGQIHDMVRGCNNAFEQSAGTLFDLRDAGIPVIACCTIVKDNVYGLHDLLDWAVLNGIELRFRIAEFVRRLYVDRSNSQIRAFEFREVKHLVAFFHHLIHFYEKKEDIKKTYASILSLLTDGERLTSCPYQNARAINIDCEGRFSHCAPHGNPYILGKRPALGVMRFEKERKRLIETHCSHCIHDYHADWSPFELIQRSRNALAHDQLFAQFEDETELVEVDGSYPTPTSLNHILLVGWYGTETAGDIAILAGILAKYVNIYPTARFTLLSLFPRYTSVTVGDLPTQYVSRITVYDYSSVNAKLATEEADAIVMAGGPLMDIPQTAMIASLFYKFMTRDKPRIIERCGIGPLNIDKYRENVIAMAKMATQISVRDHDSAIRLSQFGIKKSIKVEDDPAIDYVKSLGVLWGGANSNVICCFLRELTSEYPQKTTPEDAENKIISFLKVLLETYTSARIELLPMHYFPIGNDDRLFARKIATKIANQRITVIMEPLSPAELIARMSSSIMCITMRFHSVVFAHTIRAPFIAIDYTFGGKIASFLKQMDEEPRCFNLESLGSVSSKIIKQLAGIKILHAE